MPMISRDGRWLACEPDESGRYDPSPDRLEGASGRDWTEAEQPPREASAAPAASFSSGTRHLADGTKTVLRGGCLCLFLGPNGPTTPKAKINAAAAPVLINVSPEGVNPQA